ncbi:hypothetical protein COP2_023576 [Malus domestica]
MIIRSKQLTIKWMLEALPNGSRACINNHIVMTHSAEIRHNCNNTHSPSYALPFPHRLMILPRSTTPESGASASTRTLTFLFQPLFFSALFVSVATSSPRTIFARENIAPSNEEIAETSKARKKRGWKWKRQNKS